MSLTIQEAVPLEAASADAPVCFHCGQLCGRAAVIVDAKTFCCRGCETVYGILCESGLNRFYDLSRGAGMRPAENATPARFAFLEDPEVAAKMVDFTDGRLSRVTFHIPAIHCVACVWLLENLFRLAPGIGNSTVNFGRRELAVVFAPEKISLGRLVALLASIGYEPLLTLGQLGKKSGRSEQKKEWLRIGVAGFAFGNVMLVSLPLYLGLDSASGTLIRSLFGYISLLLALPVLVYSASTYWRSAYASLRQRALSLDVPIVIGILALYLESSREILSGVGPGYLDSLCGLVFFLLCGRMFQHKIHDRIAFDRDYTSFFPLSTCRVQNDIEETVALSDVKPGDHLRLRHGDLIPADGTLVSGEALVDYSFVSGEAEPVVRGAGEHLYAGGKQIGGSIEILTLKPVSQSYLVSLWNHQAFHKNTRSELNSLTNLYSRKFTAVVLVIACLAALGWAFAGQPLRGLSAFVSVLIVACPCALALAAPFTLGTAQRYLARASIFIRNALVLESLARVRAIVFDKTGTLTSSTGGQLEFRPEDGGPLSDPERAAVAAVASQSAHPQSMRISRQFGLARSTVRNFQEKGGAGISGEVASLKVQIGSLSWLAESGVINCKSAEKAAAYVAVNGRFRGAFVSADAVLRDDIGDALAALAKGHQIALLSGDNDREHVRFRAMFGTGAILEFGRSPVQKLEFIEALQRSKRGPVMMIGDGLNDAGAMKQSDVGVAVTEQTGAFTPSSDIVMPASEIARVPAMLALAKRSVRIVRLSFGVSAAYNLIGITIAAAGVLSPVICAVLMPLSSVSVVLFACGLTARAARQLGYKTINECPSY